MTKELLPTVAIFSLGGTIASVRTAHRDAGVAPQLSAADLLAAVPCLGEVATVIPLAFRQKSSSDLTLADISELATAIAEQRAAGVTGIVITQGTDTIEETSFALDVLLPPGAPVVVTGAMRNPTLPGADGPANIVAATRVAAAADAHSLGVLVVLNDEIHAARFVQKSHTSNPATFQSPTTGRIGWVTEDRVRIDLHPARPVPTVSARSTGFAAAGAAGAPGSSEDNAAHLAMADFPRVALIPMTLDADARLLSAVPDLGYGGLVIEGFGGGHVPAALVPAIADATAQMPVILASRTGSGEVLHHTYGTPGSEIDLLRRGLISAGSLDGRKARILLTLALAAGYDATAIRDAFAEFSRLA